MINFLKRKRELLMVSVLLILAPFVDGSRAPREVWIGFYLLIAAFIGPLLVGAVAITMVNRGRAESSRIDSFAAVFFIGWGVAMLMLLAGYFIHELL